MRPNRSEAQANLWLVAASTNGPYGRQAHPVAAWGHSASASWMLPSRLPRQSRRVSLLSRVRSLLSLSV